MQPVGLLDDCTKGTSLDHSGKAVGASGVIAAWDSSSYPQTILVSKNYWHELIKFFKMMMNSPTIKKCYNFDRAIMEFVFLLIGAGVAWFVFSFRATKSAVREAARKEFAQFITAIGAWNKNPDDFEASTTAMNLFVIYDHRRSDYVDAPTGRSIPADRALMASYWVEAMQEAQVIDRNGNKSHLRNSSRLFWNSVEKLREERDRLLQNDYGI